MKRLMPCAQTVLAFIFALAALPVFGQTRPVAVVGGLLIDGIPTGRHWLEAALELEKEAPELAERMKKNYFTWHSHGDHAHVKGSFSYALITGVKPA